MRAVHRLLVCSLIAFGSLSPAVAEPKGPKGEKCETSETKVSHKIKDKPYICDKCVFLKCDTSGKEMKNCAKVTHWSDCEEAKETKEAPKKKT